MNHASAHRLGATPAHGTAPVWPASAAVPALRRGDLVYLVGIGGAGMSGLAYVMLDRGLRVSGSDMVDSDVLAGLSWAGATVYVGHDASQLPNDTALVVRSPAVPEDNAEIVAAGRLGVPVVKRAPMLGALLDEKIGVAVAGTHGKTTTSGLLAVVLDTAGWDPTYFVGGELPDLGTCAAAGSGAHVVIEADEYDRSFLHGHPTVAVVTNVEHDHPDIYPDLDAVVEAFGAFVGRVRPSGRVIANASSPGALAVVSTCDAPVELYRVEGDPELTDGAAIAWQATDLVSWDDTQEFEVHHGTSCLGTFTIRMPGRYNVSNALAVVAACVALDVPLDAVRTGLQRYQGADRRFELVGRIGGIDVVDDYAHHPTEIRAAIAAARARYDGRVWAILQPHTFTRVAALAAGFSDALSTADRAIVTPVYAAREAPLPGVDPANIVAAVPGATLASDLQHAADLAAEGVAAGDCLLFMGAGDITEASRSCWRQLVRRSLADVESDANQNDQGGDREHDASLAPLTSLRVGGRAPLMVRVTSIVDLKAWWLLASARDVPCLLLGRGSNLLLGDGGFMGLALVNRCERWAQEPSDRADSARVVAESGLTLAALGTQLARQGWAGVEAGVGIPGSVGAAVVNNAGAHGWSMADSIAWVEIVMRDGATRRLDPTACQFTYRGSALRGDRGLLVTRVAIDVRRDDASDIAERINAYTTHRRGSQPTSPSAGSIFKNPPDDYAGRLIEAAGLKGATHGGAAISSVHANFIVNEGAASAADVMALTELARRAVLRQFGIRLELEIEPIGEQRVA